MNTITWADFERVEIRIGTILSVEPFPEAKNPAYKVTVDFGPLGIKKTSAQITKKYTIEDLPGRQVIGIVNFPPKQVANFMSEFLLTGFKDDEGAIILASVERPVPNGERLI